MSVDDLPLFTVEWQAAQGVKLDEHRATWARLEIQAGQEPVTLLEDLTSRSSRRSIFVPLYPLAEWIALHWWPLLYNARLADREYINRPDASRLADPQFRRNNFRSVGDGFAWPDLAIIPGGDQSTLSWRPYHSPTARWPIRYIGRGDLVLESSQLRLSLANLIETVIARLDEQGVGDTELHRAWREVTTMEPDVEDFCRAAARLGLDPFSDAEPYEQGIISAYNTLPEHLFGDFVDSVNPSQIHDALSWLQTVQVRLERLEATPQRGIPDINPLPGGNGGTVSARPWELGWTQAKAARASLGLGETRRFSPQQYMAVEDFNSPELRIQAIGRGTARSSRVIIGGQHVSDRARNFLLARALWHPATGDDKTFLITSAYTYKQKIERAFAAELLAPASGISKMLGDDPWSVSPEEVDRVADHFEVPSQLIKHQIENQLAAVSAD